MSAIVGFTGTQKGMTSQQKGSIMDLMRELGPVEVHHGDCIGADEEFNGISTSMDIAVVLHPPKKRLKRAYCAGTVIDVRKPREYLLRNKDIVRDSDVLIAAPRQFYEPSGRSKGGTWATVGYARNKGMPIYIVYPDGEVVKE
ncbi:MAG: hypothetical protein JRI71_16385 [Deltaproteobacteria bacterium]|nr:hypothetical protein [Deltaproteobacteria bacterium]